MVQVDAQLSAQGCSCKYAPSIYVCAEGHLLQAFAVVSVQYPALRLMRGATVVHADVCQGKYLHRYLLASGKYYAPICMHAMSLEVCHARKPLHMASHKAAP